MSAGASFSDGHVVSKQEENIYEKYEQGHEFYNSCIKFKEVQEIKVIYDMFKAKYWQDLLNDAQKKIDKSRDLFHAEFGIGGFSDKYTCSQN